MELFFLNTNVYISERMLLAPEIIQCSYLAVRRNPLLDAGLLDTTKIPTTAALHTALTITVTAVVHQFIVPIGPVQIQIRLYIIQLQLLQNHDKNTLVGTSPKHRLHNRIQMAAE